MRTNLESSRPYLCWDYTFYLKIFNPGFIFFFSTFIIPTFV